MFLHGSVLSRDFRRFAVASTSTSTVASTSTCSSSHAEVANEETHDFPSAKKVRVYNFCDKWAKERPWLEFRVTEDAMYCTFCEKYAAKSGIMRFERV